MSDVTSRAVLPGSDVTSRAVLPGSDVTSRSVLLGSDVTSRAVLPGSDVTGAALLCPCNHPGRCCTLHSAVAVCVTAPLPFPRFGCVA